MRNLKNNKNTFFIIFATMCIVALVSPLMVLATGFFESHISYSSDCGGVVLSGELEQYGKKGTISSAINVDIKPYFKFISWNDGNESLSRADVFENQDKDYIAHGRLDLNDLDILQFRCESEKITYSQSKQSLLFFESGSDEATLKELSIKILPNFENVKGQATKDFAIDSSFPLFKDSSAKKWICYSMKNDKTKAHNLVAFTLLNLLNQNENNGRFFKFANIVFEDSYSGIYVFLESSDDYCKRIYGKGIEWEATINKLRSDSFHDDYYDGYSYDVVFNNTKMSSSQITKQLHSLLVDRNQWVDSKIDKESLLTHLSINQIMKNNSGTDNDLRIFKYNNVYYFDSYSSFSLSSPMYRWMDYKYYGNYVCNNLVNNISANSNLFNDGELYNQTKELCALFNNSISSAIEYRNLHLDSIDADNKVAKSGIDDYFGIPSELEEMTSSELALYYFDWLTNRSEWLSTIYV